jgi:hypothetical protein
MKKSGSKPSPKKIPVVKETCEVVAESDKRVKYACGHEGWKRFRLSLWGNILTPAPVIFKKREACPDCLLKEALRVTIRRALCGFHIAPGDGIALYADRETFKPEWTTRHEGSAIGCLRWNCCPSGGFYAGHWDGEQFVPAFEHGTAAAECMATGKVIVTKT